MSRNETKMSRTPYGTKVYNSAKTLTGYVLTLIFNWQQIKWLCIWQHDLFGRGGVLPAAVFEYHFVKHWIFGEEAIWKLAFLAGNTVTSHYSGPLFEP